jgi:hypothetical protein
MTAQTLFVSQQRQIIELTNQYSIFAQDGGQIGSVMEVARAARRSTASAVGLRPVPDPPAGVRDAYGRPLPQLTRPRRQGFQVDPGGAAGRRYGGGAAAALAGGRVRVDRRYRLETGFSAASTRTASPSAV